MSGDEPSPYPFGKFCEYAERIEELRGNDLTAEVTDLLESISHEQSLRICTRFLRGEKFPQWKSRKVDIGPATMYAAVADASGEKVESVKQLVAERGGIGETCDVLEFSDTGGQQKLTAVSGETTITVVDVFETLDEISEVSGEGSQEQKEKMLSSVLMDCSSSREAKYFARIAEGTMRIGVGEGTVRDAISEAFDVPVALVERALMARNDTGEVAVAAKNGEEALEELEIELFRPVSPMLAQKATKKTALEELSGPSEDVPVEFKFDGSRLQIHKQEESVRLFTRRFEDVTSSMPDVVEEVRKHVSAEVAILDAEVVAYASEDAEEPEPATTVMRRVRRKYDVDEMAEEITLNIHVFDILHDGEVLIESSYSQRRKALDEACDEAIVTEKYTASNPEDLVRLEQKAVESGHEGLMVKDPTAEYHPNNRGKRWLKVKPSTENLDCVVVGGEWGEGRRKSVIGSFMLAVRGDDGSLKRVGKVATGITDEQLEELTELFSDRIIREDGKDLEFEPTVVFEVACEEILESPQYESGYGLRFPRLVRVRHELDASSADTVSRLKTLSE